MSLKKYKLIYFIMTGKRAAFAVSTATAFSELIFLCGTWLTCSNLGPETGAMHLFKSSGKKLPQIQVLNGRITCKLKCTTYIHPAIKAAH